MVDCPTCGAAGARPTLEARDANLRTSPDEFTIYVCPSCGIGFTDPRAQRMDMATIYATGYPPYSSHSPPWYGRTETGRRIKGDLDRSAGYYALTNPQLARPETIRGEPGFVWEIGCGVGELLSRFQERGWRVLGLEPSARAAEIARAAGVPVEVGRAEEATPPPEKADVIILNHSLEHIANLDAVLKKCRDALQPDGTLVIAVPNFDSPGRRFFRGAWIHLDVPRHFYHFTPEALERLLARYGFRKQRVQYDNSLEAIVTSLRNMVRERSLEASTPREGRGAGGPSFAGALESTFSHLSVVSCISAPLIPFLWLTRSQLRASMVVVFNKA
jgi:SAM-dependent methyltransferase